MGHVADRWTVPGPNGRRVKGPRWGRGRRWAAVWSEPDGTRRKQACATREEATQLLTDITHRQRSGAYITADRGRITVREYGETWLASRVDLKASSRARVESILRAHIYPRWGTTTLGDITHESVQQWVGSIPGAVATKRRVHSVLQAMLNTAVKARRIPTNEATGVRFGTSAPREHRYLTLAELQALVAAMPEHWRTFTLLLGLTGLRVGEAAELRVKDLSLPARRLQVRRTVTLVDSRKVIDVPKSRAGARTVPLPAVLVPLLEDAVRGKGREDLVFTSAQGEQINAANFRRRAFAAAVREAGLDGLRPHDLRHTAVSLAVASGASVKTVQRMVGHATAAMTLDTYAGLFDEDLDRVADSISAMFEHHHSTTGSPASP